VARAVRFIRRNAQQPLQVADVVNHLAISRSLLYKRFQAVIGRSIHDEIKRVRVEAIAKVLVSTSTPVKEIAYRLGFPGENHLSRYFKGIKGCSPQAYRQRFGRQ
jgi:LacI family transcriptional regulator